ncbi:uncharacterized protein LOC143883162 [Tasmannia lanceolata]|uniref:uncharacterized protein LOC143883162 n=1 Tax=Tasmannia lanceolata TaxID=3420 RepID=UPI00406494F3
MIGDDRLRPANLDLFGFSGEVVKVEGQIELPILVGESPCQAFTMVNFLVVWTTSVYNAILGRPGQNLICAVASAYHQKMKFITPNGVGEVRGDQLQSRECYAMALKGKNTTESLPIELLNLRDEAQGAQRAENLISIPLCKSDGEKVVRIGSSLDNDTRHSLIQFLQDNTDVFAWAPTDMPGINPEIIMYESDILKTSFVTDQGTYCYRVMPFGLKNAGTTYQRLVNKLFRNQIGRDMEVYVDDMLVKSRSAQDHVSDLEETFQVLRDNKMKLNPTKPAIKAQVLADFVAECSIPQQITELEVAQAPAARSAIAAGEPAEDGAGTGIILAPPAEQDPSTAESLWEVHVDGSSNKAGCGAGLVLTGPDSFALDYALRFGFRASNNEAEYEALLAGMNLAVQTGAQRLKAYCDSQLVANQIQGIYEARDERMIKYLSQVRQLSSKFKSFEVVRIPRTENTKADVLSKLAASGYTTLGNICMEFLQASSIERKAVEIMQVEHESCWMDEIVDYLRSGRLPEAKREARKVIQRAARFSLVGENLFKRSYTLPYLKCLRPSDAAYALQETHEEAVIPVEVATPSARITNFNEQLNDDGLRANLDLLEEAREESRIRVAAYKQKVSRYHDSKMRPREFRVGDLVLRKAAISQPKKVRKLSPTWEGPYRVKEVIRPGSYRLETLEEQPLPHAWNSKNLRKYHQ